MKTLLPLSFIAAIFAFLIFPLSFEVAMSLLVGAGFTTIAFSDYSRTSRVLPVATAAGHAIASRERFGLAA